MKTYYTVLLVILFLSCTGKKTTLNKENNKVAESEIVVAEFQLILDDSNLEGSILIYDPEQDSYYSNNFEWAKSGKLPASTFKITNSIIALETGTVENDSTLFKWNGEKRNLKNWEQDLILRDAFHFSCVPCYQEVARKIGVKKMRNYLDKLKYGDIVVDSTNIDKFWLEGESTISQFQQIDFLKRFYRSELRISEPTEAIMKRMMIMEENDSFKLSGKTGWSTQNDIDNGWFVGYIETRNKTYFFATNVKPKPQFNMDLFPMIRKGVTFKALKQLRIIE